MSKAVRAVLYGFIVAVVVGAAIGWLDTVSPDGPYLNPIWYGAFAGLFTAFIFGNLAGNRSIANASDADKNAALARTPPPGKALLYVYREGFVAKMAGLNLFIDGRPVAQIKAPHFTTIIVPARQFTLSAAFGGLAGAQSKKTEQTIDASQGGAIAVRITIAMGLVQGTVKMEVQPGGEQARTRLASMAMTPADVPEI